jgi:peptidoglycan/LPS O-acetylase OafA/YrhL
MAAGRGTRLEYLDNLKWVLIAGVIFVHAATAYGSAGAWLYVEPTLAPLSKNVLSVLIEAGDLFALGTFMLVAGLLSTRSVARKGIQKFLGDRLLRLGLPVVATVVVVTPFAVWMIVAATGFPLTLPTYVRWQLRWLDPGPMWFAGVLLLFTFCYAAWRWVRPAGRRQTEPLRIRHVLVAAALIATLTFLIRLIFPVGSIQPLELHIWQWPQLGILFAFGVLAGERGWLDARPAALIRWACWIAPPVALTLLFASVPASGADVTTGSGMALYSGGAHWQAAVTALAEGTVAVCASLALIDLFRQFAAWHGRLTAALGRDSYSAFFLHMPVLIALEMGLRRFTWPGEAKLAVSAPAAIVICFTLAWGVRRAFGAAKTPFQGSGRRPLDRIAHA